MNFGNWLKEKRQAARMSQEELSVKAGCSKNYISVLERSLPHPETGALPQPTRKVVMALAGALNVPLAEALEAAGYAPQPFTLTINREKRTFEERELSDEDKRRLQEAADIIQSILGNDSPSSSDC